MSIRMNSGTEENAGVNTSTVPRRQIMSSYLPRCGSSSSVGWNTLCAAVWSFQQRGRAVGILALQRGFVDHRRKDAVFDGGNIVPIDDGSPSGARTAILLIRRIIARTNAQANPRALRHQSQTPPGLSLNANTPSYGMDGPQ